MNNIVAVRQNDLIEHIAEESFANKVFNRVIRVIQRDKVCSLTLSFIGSTIGLAFQIQKQQLSYSETLDFFVDLLMYTNLFSMASIVLLDLSLLGKLFLEIQNNPIPQAVEGRRRIISEDISDVLPYNELQQLPANYQYEKDDICPISYEKLTQGDTVCCDKKLYSYLSLKDCYTHCFKLIPHSLNPLKWNENVYKLPEYSAE